MPLEVVEHSNENDVVAELRQGSQHAFDVIFRRYHQALCFFARRLMPDSPPGQAEELVQDAFLKLWERRANFEKLTAVKAFLYIATRNACLNCLERERVQQRKQAQYLYTVADSEEAVIDEIIYTEVLREVSQAIETLPEQCQRIIKMAYEEGLSPKEIASKLNLSISTINNQKSRGISLLKRRISNVGFNFLLVFL